MEDKDKDKGQSAKKELIPIEKLISGKNLPDWQVQAFIQFTGWITGKQVSKNEFDTKFFEFTKKYLGGKK